MAQKRNPKYDCTPDMYKKGLSIQEIANYFDITRQAMHKILKRRGVIFRSGIKHGSHNHFYRGGEVMSKRAGHLVEKAIKKGLIVPGPCEVCEKYLYATDGRSLIHAHHDDYNKPLDIRWLCQRHHHSWHKKNKAKEIEKA